MDQQLSQQQKQTSISQKQTTFFTLNQKSINKANQNHHKIFKVLNKAQWVADMGIYRKMHIYKMVPQILQSTSQKIWISYNARSSILKDIIHIKFRNLKEISFASNYIDSIQSLSFLDSPFLQDLQLRQNRICSVKALKKLKFHKITTLSLYNNASQNTSCLSHCDFPKLKTVWLEYQNQQTVQGQSINWVSKCQSSNLRSIAIASKKRMKQDKFQLSVCKKYQPFKIYRAQN